MNDAQNSLDQSTDASRRGLMLVLSSPSGAGKSSIARQLLLEEGNLTMSVSATTRPARPDETDGRDYHFVHRNKFNVMISDGAFLEYATVFDNSYGTPKADVMATLESGVDVLFDIDWQGTQQIANAAPTDLVSVFILPPSRAELYRRLKSRGQDSDEVVAARMARASDEISHYAEYEYIIINDDLQKSVKRIKAILMAERMRRARQTGLTAIVRKLTAES